MCLAYPGTVIEIAGRKAIIQYPSFTRQVLVGEKNIGVGDKVLVQMGIVVKKISAKESKSILDAFSTLQ